jgi:ribosome-associated translation inhibitor RaiA
MSSLDNVVKSFGSSVHAQVSLILETRHHQKGEIYLAEILLYLPGKEIVVKTEADTIYNAIDAMKH